MLDIASLTCTNYNHVSKLEKCLSFLCQRVHIGSPWLLSRGPGSTLGTLVCVSAFIYIYTSIASEINGNLARAMLGHLVTKC